MKQDTYLEMKKRHSEDIDSFEGIFFAFNNQQFEEGMNKIGLTVNDKNQIYSIGAGGYILKTKSQDFENMLTRHQTERKELKQNEKKLLAALVYELQNHEYCISRDEEPALNALGLDKEDINPVILKKALRLAR